MLQWWKNSHQVIRVTESTHRWPSQAIGPAQTQAGDVGVSDMGWCLRRFRRVTLKALWCVQTMSRDVPISNPHYTCSIPGSIQFIYFSCSTRAKWRSDALFGESVCLLFFTRLGNVATAASIIWIREGHDWSCWLVTWLLARDVISKLQVDHPRQQWSNDQEM